MQYKAILAGVVACLIALSFTACHKNSSAQNSGGTTTAAAQFDETVSCARQAIAGNNSQGVIDALKKLRRMPLTEHQRGIVDQTQG